MRLKTAGYTAVAAASADDDDDDDDDEMKNHSSTQHARERIWLFR